MKLSEFKQMLSSVTELKFQTNDGTEIPNHFHITEVGQVDKKNIDCGGVIRLESKINMQIWTSTDINHRLTPSKLANIISLSESKLNIGDHEIELEYQGNTIGKYGVEFENGIFKLTTTQTNCLAMDKCGIPNLESKIEKNTCTPGGGCC